MNIHAQITSIQYLAGELSVRMQGQDEEVPQEFGAGDEVVIMPQAQFEQQEDQLLQQMEQIEDLRMITEVLLRWQEESLVNLEKMQGAESVVIQKYEEIIGIDERIDLTPEQRAGYRLGIHCAIQVLKTFPLSRAEEAEIDDQSDATPT